jgi:hypothetical protein
MTTTRIAEIASTIRNTCSPLVMGIGAKDDATEVLKIARESEANAREDTLLRLAHESEAGGWTLDEISQAAPVAAAMSQGIKSPKAFATYIGEAKNAMHPLARGHAEELYTLRRDVWDAETAAWKADKNTPTPCRTAWARGYHMFVAMLTEAGKGNLITDAGTVLELATTSNPHLDPKKGLAELASAREALRVVYSNFPAWLLEDAIALIDKIEEHDLARARETRSQAPTIARAEKPAKGKPAPVPVTVMPEIAMGPVEVDAFLNGHAVH